MSPQDSQHQPPEPAWLTQSFRERKLNFDSITTATSEVMRVLTRARELARSDRPMLIWGERGTGKSLLSQAIHNASHRHDGPSVRFGTEDFLASNLLPEDEKVAAICSELFGTAKQSGAVESASQGTLLLENIQVCPTLAQLALIEFIEHRVYHPVGSNHSRAAELRIICTITSLPEHTSWEQLATPELAQALQGIVLRLPPLRERKPDILIQAKDFLEKLCLEHEKAMPELSDSFVATCEERPWYGNFIELRDAMREALLSSNGGELTEKDLPPQQPCPKSHRGPIHLPNLEEREQRELDEAIEALRQTKGHVGQASKLLDKSQATFYRWLEKQEINPKEFS